MIYYIACKHRALGVQLTYFPGELARKVRLIAYDDLFAREVLPGGTYIFADFDRMPADQFPKLCRLWDAFDETNADIRRINDPRRVLQRFALLRRLYELGINDFNVYRFEDWKQVRQFPVFIRKEKHQKAPLTGLLPDRASLEKAIAKLDKVAGRGDLLIVELCKGVYEGGRYRKYGAFRVGDVCYVQHLYASEHWYVKSGTAEITDAQVAENREYRRRNPHAEQIRTIFDIAGIEYGRMDYGVVGDRIQVFEVNTHPTVISLSSVHEPNPKIDSAYFARMHEEAMLPLAEFKGTPWRLPAELIDRSRGSVTIDEAHARALAESIVKIEKAGGAAKLSKVVGRLWPRQRSKAFFPLKDEDREGDHHP